MTITLPDSRVQLFALFVLYVALVLLHVYRHDPPALLPDALLAGVALIWWQSVPLAAAALILYGLRHHWRPLTSAERDLVARVPWLFPGAARRQPRTGATQVLRPATLPMHEWMRRANDLPDLIPHMAVTGPTGSGKTTLMLPVLDRRAGDLVIITPKHEDDDPWGGCPAVRLNVTAQGVDWTPAAEAVETVYGEWLRRMTYGARNEAWMTLVIDEFPSFAKRHPELADQVLEMAGTARGAHIRLVLLGTETSVEAWDWRGRGDARKNLLFIECDYDITTLARSAVMYRFGQRERAEALDLRHVMRLALKVRLDIRAWPGLAFVPVRVPASVSVSVVPTHKGDLGTDGRTDAGTDLGTLRKLRAQGVKREDARAQGYRFRNEDWRAAGE